MPTDTNPLPAEVTEAINQECEGTEKKWPQYKEGMLIGAQLALSTQPTAPMYGKPYPITEVKVGDIVPYINTRGNVKCCEVTSIVTKEFQSDNVSAERPWFRGLDTVTKAKVYYPCWKAIELSEPQHAPQGDLVEQMQVAIMDGFTELGFIYTDSTNHHVAQACAAITTAHMHPLVEALERIMDTAERMPDMVPGIATVSEMCDAQAEKLSIIDAANTALSTLNKKP